MDICIYADLDTPAADNAVPKTSKKGTARGLVDTHGGVNFGGKVAVECKEHRDALRYQITVINVTLSCRVNDATGAPRDTRVKRKVCMWVIQVVLFGGGGASHSGKVGRDLVQWRDKVSYARVIACTFRTYTRSASPIRLTRAAHRGRHGHHDLRQRNCR
jgi:hypothetical protein